MLKNHLDHLCTIRWSNIPIIDLVLSDHAMCISRLILAITTQSIVALWFDTLRTNLEGLTPYR
jgi:hypothetical protein